MKAKPATDAKQMVDLDTLTHPRVQFERSSKLVDESTRNRRECSDELIDTPRAYRVTFQQLGTIATQMEFLDESVRVIVAPDGDTAEPSSVHRTHDEIGRIGTNVNRHEISFG